MQPFALLIALLGRRSEEAAPLQPRDLGDDYVLHFRRIIYKRRLVELKDDEQIHMPLDPNEYWHAELIRRLRRLGKVVTQEVVGQRFATKQFATSRVEAV